MTALQPPLSPEAVRYALRELARRAGVRGSQPDGDGFESIGLRVLYGPAGRADGDAPMLVIEPCREGDWRRVVALAPRTLDSVSLENALPPGARRKFGESVPILFRGVGREGSGGFAEIRGRVLVFHCDLVASTLFLLSRWEEAAGAARDEHDRFPHTESVAFRQGFLDRPLIDEYALILREWIRVLLPSWAPTTGSFRIQLSHDIDVVRPFGTLGSAVRTIVTDLVKRRDPAHSAWSAEQACTQMLAPDRTDFFRGIRQLAEISKRHHMRSAFYVMAADSGPYDSGYDPRHPQVRACIRELRAEGFEIGFHPSYRTLGDPELMAVEKGRVEEAVGAVCQGGRQHYLRFRVPETWRQWERLGLTYDSTMTFAGHEGFRCGTSHAYRPFDLEQNRELEIWERPLIVMDGTLRQYRGLTPEQAIDRVRELARRCQAVEGTFTLLWHNSSLAGEWVGWGQAYERMIDELLLLTRAEADDGASEPSPEAGVTAGSFLGVGMISKERQIGR